MSEKNEKSAHLISQRIHMRLELVSGLLKKDVAHHLCSISLKDVFSNKRTIGEKNAEK